MPDVTDNYDLPYPCVEDPQERQGIEDLAVAADLALNWIKSDLDYVSNRPKAQMRRPAGTVQSIAAGAPAVITYTTTDYDNANPAWAATGTGLLTPHLAGIYYVDFSIRESATTPNFGDSYTVDIQYNGVSILFRKLGAATPFPIKLAGLVKIVPASPLPALRARLQTFGAGTPVEFERARLALQFLARCSAPLNANPWFEQTIAPWTGQAGAAVALETSVAYRGNTSMQVSGPTGGAAWSEAIPAAAGIRYFGQMWSRSQTGSNVNWTPQLRWYDAGMVLLSTSNGTFVSSPPASFIVSTVNAVAPASTAFVQLAGFHSGVSPTFDVAIDDATLIAAC